MIRALFIANALLTLPFALAALAAPAPVFAQFGVVLDPGGQLIARGYAATLLGYGLVIFLLRNTTDTGVIRAFLLSMALFNAVEAVIQGVAGAQGVAASMIFGNVALHAVLAVLCLAAWNRPGPGVRAP
jgi:hypothetical protein